MALTLDEQRAVDKALRSVLEANGITAAVAAKTTFGTDLSPESQTSATATVMSGLTFMRMSIEAVRDVGLVLGTLDRAVGRIPAAGFQEGAWFYDGIPGRMCLAHHAPRNFDIDVAAGWEDDNTNGIIITGTDSFGYFVTERLEIWGEGTYETNVAFRQVTSISSEKSGGVSALATFKLGSKVGPPHLPTTNGNDPGFWVPRMWLCTPAYDWQTMVPVSNMPLGAGGLITNASSLILGVSLYLECMSTLPLTKYPAAVTLPFDPLE